MRLLGCLFALARLWPRSLVARCDVARRRLLRTERGLLLGRLEVKIDVGLWVVEVGPQCRRRSCRARGRPIVTVRLGIGSMILKGMASTCRAFFGASFQAPELLPIALF